MTGPRIDPHFARYIAEASDLLTGISVDEIAGVAHVIADTFHRDGLILLAGNGGSAALASHFAVDLSKSTLGRPPDERRRRLRAIGLTDNVPLLTAWANDEGYDVVFSEQVKSLARTGDTLLVVTASGNSPNVIRALETARDRGMRRIGLLGFDGGRAKGLVDACVHVRSRDYGMVEVAHGLVAHLITDWLCERASADATPAAARP